MENYQTLFELIHNRIALVADHAVDVAGRRKCDELLRQHDAVAFQSKTVAPSEEHIGLLHNLLLPSVIPNSLGKLGSFEVLQIIAAYDWSLILEGFDTSLERIVVIGVLTASVRQSSNARDEFLRRGKKVAAIQHPNIIQILDIGEQNDFPFVVTAYGDGQLLEQRLALNEPLRADTIQRYGRQLAQGLMAYHEVNLVLGCINSSSVCISTNEEHARLVPYSLKSCIYHNASTAALTAESAQFLSPEQVDGRAVDGRSDLFSLGAILYMMATGNGPFSSARTEDAMQRVKETTPQPIEELNLQIPRALATIIGRLLKKDPEKRIQTAVELAELLDEQPVAVKAKPPERASRYASPRASALSRIRTHWLWLAIVVCLISSLLSSYLVKGPLHWARRGEGLLSIDVDDPTLMPVVDGFICKFENGMWNLHLSPGGHEVTVVRNGSVVFRQQVSINWWEHQLMRIDDSYLMAQLKSLPPEDAAARWLIFRSAPITGHWHGERRIENPIWSIDQIPAGDFGLASIQLCRLTPSKLSDILPLLSSCPRLTDLYLEDLHLSSEAVASLASLGSVRRLHLSNVMFEQRKDVLALAKLSELQDLSVTYSPAAREFCEVVSRMPNIRELTMDDCPVTDEMFQTIATNGGLESLTVNSRFLTDAAIEDLLEMPLIVNAKLNSPLFTNESLEDLVAWKKLRTLNSLQISTGHHSWSRVFPSKGPREGSRR